MAPVFHGRASFRVRFLPAVGMTILRTLELKNSLAVDEAGYVGGAEAVIDIDYAYVAGAGVEHA